MKATNSTRSWPVETDAADQAKGTRLCDHPGCGQDGEYRAPRSRDKLNDYYWFCLDHVRAYNAAWDFYAGMTSEQIERELRQDSTWQRPTWPLGSKGSKRRFGPFDLHDPLGVFDAEPEASAAPRPAPLTPEDAAMCLLDLTPPLTLAALKARYKELVKRHHPDANGGDKAAEEKFKQINQAYNILLRSLGG
jgi:DnaJ-domain-containing protein 1